LKLQYSRYTPEMVERITGIPKGSIPQAAELFHFSAKETRHMKRGWQRFYMQRAGPAYFRYADQFVGGDLAKLILANVGRAGGGVQWPCGGHSNIQAPGLGGVFDIFSGLSKDPSPRHVDLAAFLNRTTAEPSKANDGIRINNWSNTAEFMVSF